MYTEKMFKLIIYGHVKKIYFENIRALYIPNHIIKYVYCISNDSTVNFFVYLRT